MRNILAHAYYHVSLPILWKQRLGDIRGAASKILAYTEGLDLAAFTGSERTVDAVRWNFATIGEAAGNVPADVRARFPELPWQQMRGMRNRLIRVYDLTDEEVVWLTLTERLPPLIKAIDAILGPNE